ncbi:MAG: DUF4366 domain-containing protein, partial [Clostridiales bacterium]|nr:DUF4366 domain-containing protein [Clostridiales bacterium]
GKEFYTFKTPKDNVFYLIIDRQRGSENVYLLNQVTEQDLMALAKDDGKEQIITPTPTPMPSPSPSPSPTPAHEPAQTEAPRSEQKNGLDPKLMIVLLLAGAGIAIGYYFKVIRPKRKKTAFNSDLHNSGDTEDEGGLGEGFDYREDEIPYDQDDDWDD